MPGWRIKAWSRELGRGEVESLHQVLEFDGAIALTDDFTIGEEVHVELAGPAEDRQVAKLWPDEMRLQTEGDPASAAPLLRGIAEAVAPVLQAFESHIDYRVADWTPTFLTIEADDSGFLHGVLARLVLAGVSYVQLPATWSGHKIVLARPKERAHIAGIVDITDSDIVVKILDDGGGIHFVVCTDAALAD